MTQWTTFNLKVAGIVAAGNRELDQLLVDTRKQLLLSTMNNTIMFLKLNNETWNLISGVHDRRNPEF